MESFVIRASEHEGWPYLVLMGEGSRELATRVAEYVDSLEVNPHSEQPSRKIEPMHPEAWLAEYTGDDHCDLAVVAVLGQVSAEDAIQMERLRSAADDRCIMVLDTETGVGSSWKSVIRMPGPGEFSWAECMQMLLSVLLLPAADCGRIGIPVNYLQHFLRGRQSYLAIARENGDEGIKDAISTSLCWLTQQEVPSAFDSLIVTAPGRPGITVSEIHRVLSACRDTLPNLLSWTFLRGCEDNNRLSIGLIAGKTS